MRVEIAENKEIAEGTLYTKFSLSEKVKFKAGQFFELTYPNPPYTDERGSKRFLGFINSPNNNTYIETVIRKGPSAFKRSLAEAPLGTVLEIGGIDGDMVLPEENKSPWTIITGGIGIVPYMSMFRKVKEDKLDYNITVIYSNTKESWAIFLDELRKYKKDDSFKLVPIMTQDPNWQGETRRIDEGVLKDFIQNPQQNTIYISGTPRFVPSMVKAVKKIGASQEKLKFEVFTGY